MSGAVAENLSGVSETALIPLYIRAVESQRPDALVKDEKAEALVRQMDQDFLRKKLAKIKESSQVAIILRSREFDRHAQDFLARHPQAVVVHIGCGLDSRFERVDNGEVEWYDLDLPEVIELRRKLIDGERRRYHLLACSVLEHAWLDTVEVHHQPPSGTPSARPPFLFLAEGVLMYLELDQVRSLVHTLTEHFPGAQLVFDAFSPFFSWANNLRVTLTGVGACTHWALKHGTDLEQWSGSPLAPRAAQWSLKLPASIPGVHLLDERFPFQYPEPRLGRALAVRHIPFFTRTIGVFHYLL